MIAQPAGSPPAAASPPAGRLVRVEYLDFQNVREHREYRFRVCGLDGSAELRVRIALTAFGAGLVRMQDGPDVCYQRLSRVVAAGETASPVAITIDDDDLVEYREAHVQASKRRSWTPSSAETPATPDVVRVKRPPARSPQLPLAPLVTNESAPPFGEGQRVSHTVFGVGVTISSSDSHTVISFDVDGPRTFVTSMLKLDVLSAPHTWETSPRGKNRPCRPPGLARTT